MRMFHSRRGLNWPGPPFPRSSLPPRTPAPRVWAECMDICSISHTLMSMRNSTSVDEWWRESNGGLRGVAGQSHVCAAGTPPQWLYTPNFSLPHPRCRESKWRHPPAARAPPPSSLHAFSTHPPPPTPWARRNGWVGISAWELSSGIHPTLRRAHDPGLDYGLVKIFTTESPPKPISHLTSQFRSFFTLFFFV